MDKPQPYLLPRVTEAAFSDLREMIIGEEDFPRTFGEWQALWDHRRKEEEGDGHKPVFVKVIPTAFAKFCKVHGKPAGWNSLGHYITAKTAR